MPRFDFNPEALLSYTEQITGGVHYLNARDHSTNHSIPVTESLAVATLMADVNGVRYVTLFNLESSTYPTAYRVLFNAATTAKVAYDAAHAAPVVDIPVSIPEDDSYNQDILDAIDYPEETGAPSVEVIDISDPGTTGTKGTDYEKDLKDSAGLGTPTTMSEWFEKLKTPFYALLAFLGLRSISNIFGGTK